MKTQSLLVRIPVATILRMSKERPTDECAFWHVSEMFIGATDANQCTLRDKRSFYAGSTDLTLHPDAIPHYRENLAQRPPRLYVVFSGSLQRSPAPYVQLLTVAPSEAGNYSITKPGCVIGLPLPRTFRILLSLYLERAGGRNSPH